PSQYSASAFNSDGQHAVFSLARGAASRPSRLPSPPELVLGAADQRRWTDRRAWGYHQQPERPGSEPDDTELRTQRDYQLHVERHSWSLGGTCLPSRSPCTVLPTGHCSG